MFDSIQRQVQRGAYPTRSDFIRDALKRKLEVLGVQLETEDFCKKKVEIQPIEVHIDGVTLADNLNEMTLKILQILSCEPMNMFRLSERLEKSYSIIWTHIENMKNQGLISCEWVRGKNGVWRSKRCKLTTFGLHVLSSLDRGFLAQNAPKVMANYRGVLLKSPQLKDHLAKGFEKEETTKFC